MAELKEQSVMGSKIQRYEGGEEKTSRLYFTRDRPQRGLPGQSKSDEEVNKMQQANERKIKFKIKL